MEWMEENCYWLLWGGAALCLAVFYIFRRKRVKTFLLGGSSGLAALLLLHFFGGTIGFAPTLCLTNLVISVLFGIPGVALLTISELLLG